MMSSAAELNAEMTTGHHSGNQTSNGHTDGTDEDRGMEVDSDHLSLVRQEIYVYSRGNSI